MNVKEKFIWDALVAVAVIIYIISGYLLYKMDVEKTAFVETYQNETIGTDSALTKSINDLEKNFVERQNYQFKLKKYPTDLSRVIIFDAGELRGYGGSKVHFSAGVTGKQHHAIAHYKNRIFHVTVGDSVAGGLVTAITDTSVSFSKDGDLKTYSLLPDIDSKLEKK
ncbi:MAG: hypothetical protein GXO91_03465 [FCB group bacterium]|nr:hypothetical protein [FCB group bacterium]